MKVVTWRSIRARWGDLANLVLGGATVALGLGGLYMGREAHVLALKQATSAREEFELETAGTDIEQTMSLAERSFSDGTITELLAQMGLVNLLVGFSLGVIVAGGVAMGGPSAWRLGRRAVERWAARRRGPQR